MLSAAVQKKLWEDALEDFEDGVKFTLNAYQKEASVTSGFSPRLYMKDAQGAEVEVPYVYPALGLGEAGEVQNKIKKIMRDGNGSITKEMREAIKGELGGLLWYIAETARNVNLTLQDVAVYNITQLRDRAVRNVINGSGDNR